MKITPNSVVAVTYELFLGETNDQDEEFDLAEVVGEDNPLVLIHGMSGLPESFEAQLLGLEANDTFNFWIEPEEGYGEFDEEAIVEFPTSMFAIEEGNVPEGMLELGNVIPFTNDDGSQLVGRVIDANDETVTVDFNHPLAGKAMHFEGKVLSVRAATPDELDHGHVHGEGGVIH